MANGNALESKGGSCLREWLVIWKSENMGYWCTVLLHDTFL